MNILKKDIDKISSNLKIDTDIVNNIINDFDNILQPVIQQNYLSHLVSSIETIINEKIKEKLHNELIKTDRTEEEIKQKLYLIDTKYFRVFPILLKPFPTENKKKAICYDIKTGGAIILYDKNMKDTQKRLLIAHELGHLYLKYVSTIKDKKELEKIVTVFGILAILDKDDFYKNRTKDLISKSIDEILSNARVLFKFN
ncbi:ImmA/IrrE family metallo-endopeptidase [Brachyspira aalborgi]|uniref:ImmA/IrrE family metallo-endopeptidase n=1 Tax=Brachyspira aalborgi TaxID=29522 RepID=A0A5C8F640_9SPIR|nr:ImmA/IrrE family metallo-endopeptidase [Brachyspira aalborgi]TXJ45253.1 ImmA/IrrE family metallo-endopeptidase [Brachyspira aalborgi]